MRKTLRLLPHILSIALVVGIVSCSKDGPAGPAGATGPAGTGAPGRDLQVKPGTCRNS